MLYVSGLLNPEMGGPGVMPPVPPGTLSDLSATAVAGGWKVDADASKHNRRSVYVFVRRNLLYPMLHEFDTANTFEVWHQRKNTVTPSQSLDLMNNETILGWAQALAGRVLKDARVGTESLEQVDRAFRVVYGRRPAAEEQKISAEFLGKQVPIMAARLTATQPKLSMPAYLPEGLEPARAAALVDLCHMLLASNEFLYIN
jgi:hypothetical protein